MNLIYLEKFNNYYNRRVKYYDDYQSYINEAENYLYNAGVDFNGNDGVSTIKTANLDIAFNPDYMLVLDEATSSIISRWFVLEMKRLRNGQYNITLRRDVIADHYESISTAPIFVQKGNVGTNNPLIFNKEGFTCNQVKTGEIILKEYDNDTPWIVGYIGNDAFNDGSKTINVPNPTVSIMSIAELPIKLKNELDPSEGATLSTFADCNIGFQYTLTKGVETLFRNIYTKFSYDHGFYDVIIGVPPDLKRSSAIEIKNSNATQIKDAFSDGVDYYNNALFNGLEAFLDGTNQIIATTEEASIVQQLQGKTFYFPSNNKFYRLSFTGVQSSIKNIQDFTWNKFDRNPSYLVSMASTFEAIIDYMSQLLPNAEIDKVYPFEDQRIRKMFFINYTLLIKDINLVEVTPSEKIQVELTSAHNKLMDAPYSMFAMPFDLTNMALASKMASELSGYIYDIQILPYCPARELLNSEGTDVSETASLNQDYNRIINGDNKNVSFVLWSTTSSGTFNIYQTIGVNTDDPIELKVSNECDLYRIVSPNYNGAFEFSAAMNLGVDYFEVSYTYKPYSPFIQVNPSFKNLYGEDFNDARGLICNGNFSIATLTDQWKTYEINNKNYENIFNAQIKTMDKNNSLNLLSQGITTPLNAVSAGIGIGSLAGPWAGVAAGAASLVGGAADMAIGQSMYQNNRQLQKDMFAMNLQNIHARPDTLNKISAYNINNKYFPFVEYYTCTDVEKDAFRNKLKYEGMTLGVIGTINEFVDQDKEYNFFKGSPVLLESLKEDYHIADAIAVELEKGVYI